MRERQREGEPEKRSVFFGLLQPWRELGERGGEAAKRRDPAFVSYPPPGDKPGGEGGWG